MRAGVVPVLAPVRIHVGAPMSLRSLFRLPPFLLRILPIGRRNVRFFSSTSSTETASFAVSSTLVVIVWTGILFDGPARQGARSVIVSYVRGSIGVAAHLNVVLRSFFRKLYLSFRLLFERLRHRGVSLALIEVITIFAGSRLARDT